MPQLVKNYSQYSSLKYDPAPAEEGYYLVAFTDGDECYTGEALWQGGRWYECDARTLKAGVYAWAAMPTAPAPFLFG